MKGVADVSGDQLLRVFSALANPHRLRILATLQANGRDYISRLARQVGISRPLLHLHLQKLEEAGLVSSRLELSEDGKALNYFEITDFKVLIHPDMYKDAIRTLKAESRKQGD